jgi:hypothetical protein
MEFESKAVGFRIETDEISNPEELLDDLVQSHLDFYDNLKNHDKGESAHLVFAGGSKIFISRSENESEELGEEISISYLPGDEEKNYETSSKVISAVETGLSGHEYSINYMTVGGIIEEDIKTLLNRHIEMKSEFDVNGIELKRGKCKYGISSKSDADGQIRVTAVIKEHEENLPDVKEELKNKLEEFANEGE